MSILDFTTTTLGDLCLEALRESGVVGRGMTARADETSTAWTRMQWVLQDWERKRWMVYALKAVLAPSNGTSKYSVGGLADGADFNLSASDFNNDFNDDFGGQGPVNRPAQLESVFFRQSVVGGVGAPLDYPLEQIQDGNDYWSRMRLKNLPSWPQFAYYEAAYPVGVLYVYPVIPLNVGYQLGIVIRRSLNARFATQATQVQLPPEYHAALVASTALSIRSAYQIPVGPGDVLAPRAASLIRTIRKSNTRVGQLVIPERAAGRGGRYNIYSDSSD